MGFLGPQSPSHAISHLVNDSSINIYFDFKIIGTDVKDTLIDVLKRERFPLPIRIFTDEHATELGERLEGAREFFLEDAVLMTNKPSKVIEEMLNTLIALDKLSGEASVSRLKTAIIYDMSVMSDELLKTAMNCLSGTKIFASCFSFRSIYQRLNEMD
jgi:hypothetical protein